MASIFTRIIQGEIPCHKIEEDERFLAFLDIAPLAIGHVLVIPKEEVDYIFDMDPSLLADLHVFSQKVAKKIAKAIPCKRVGVAVIGLEVPHAHVHLVPLNHVSDINFERPKMDLSQEELAVTAKAIREA